MKTLIYTLILIALCFSASAKSIKIKPKYIDLDPNDNFMDPGSPSNPYVAEDENGNEIGTVEPEYYDIDPDDGFMDPGSSFNNWKINLDD